ncbi:MAG: hypothetical protein ABI600_07955, partial [Luteolibacter sp.]
VSGIERRHHVHVENYSKAKGEGDDGIDKRRHVSATPDMRRYANWPGGGNSLGDHHQPPPRAL